MKDNITAVPGYELSEEVYRFIDSAFAENSALKSRWEGVYSKSELSENKPFEHVLRKFEPSERDKLLIMAIEYFLLSSLSHHLEEYFQHKRLENITKYERKDIPSVLLSNSFFEMFSRPMNERPAFVDFGPSDYTVAAAWSGGAYYEKFELTLPRGSIIRRPENNKIEIETKKLKVTMAVRFEGFSTILPRYFEEYYLNLELQQKETPKGIEVSYGIYPIYIDIQITVKLRAILSNIGWEYYEWVDSFLRKIEKDVSREAFFKRINWESNVTLLQCLDNDLNIIQTKPEKDKEVDVSQNEL